MILRADGAAGNVPLITACIESGIHYITRLQNYQLLQDKEVVGHLNEAEWFNVPSSGSGPNRQATDLGLVVLEPAVNTEKTGATSGAQTARVVPTRGSTPPVFADGLSFAANCTTRPEHTLPLLIRNYEDRLCTSASHYTPMTASQDAIPLNSPPTRRISVLNYVPSDYTCPL